VAGVFPPRNVGLEVNLSLSLLLQALGGGGEGKLRSASERLGLVSAISALSSADAASAGASAEIAVDFLCKYYRSHSATVTLHLHFAVVSLHLHSAVVNLHCCILLANTHQNAIHAVIIFGLEAHSTLACLWLVRGCDILRS